MILLADIPIPIQLTPGAVYQARADLPGKLRPEVQNVWAYLQQATQHPIALTLFSHSQGDAAPLADLATAPPPSPPDTDTDRSTITLLTSGTTGPPKRITHDLLNALNRKKPGDPAARWLLTYAPFRWAGLSVMLHVFKSKASLIVPTSLSPGDLIAAATEHAATHISLTPSYLRRWELTVGADALAALPFKQITFGGEAASQPVLDTARRLWPTARITHVYASTELGDVCAVSDGQAGVPDAKFSGDRFAFTDTGELVIDGYATGDLWDHRDGRYHFLGRDQEMINVGGAKVSPIAVENAAMTVPGVEQARAYAQTSPLLGQVVAMDYRGTATERQIRLALRDQLPKTAWPAQIQQVDTIDLTPAGKTPRPRK